MHGFTPRPNFGHPPMTRRAALGTARCSDPIATAKTQRVRLSHFTLCLSQLCVNTNDSHPKPTHKGLPRWVEGAHTRASAGETCPHTRACESHCALTLRLAHLSHYPHIHPYTHTGPPPTPQARGAPQRGSRNETRLDWTAATPHRSRSPTHTHTAGPSHRRL